MFAIEKLDSFNEAMNSAYVPVSVSQPNSDLSGKSDFMKTLETKSKNEDSVEISSARKPKVDTDKKIDKNDEEVNRNTKGLKDQNKKRPDQNEPEKQEKTIDKNAEKESGKKTETAAKQTDGEEGKKVPKKTGEKASDSVKELLQKHQIKIEEIGEMKEGAAEKFTEGKTRTAGTATEKIVLNNLSGDKNETKAKTETETETVDTDEPVMEKKILKELEIKEENIPLKNEPKVSKTQTHENNNNNTFNLLDQNNKQMDQVKEIQVKKVLNHQNMFEQYQGLKDKVTESVENSIKFLMTNGESRVTMQLQPPELGKVEVELLIKDNQVTAKINTESIAVKEVILSNLDQLKSNLASAGTGVDKFDVEVGGFKNQLDQHFSDGGSGGSGNREKGNEGGTQDPNEPMPGKIKNHQALTHFLGRSINVVI